MVLVYYDIIDDWPLQVEQRLAHRYCRFIAGVLALFITRVQTLIGWHNQPALVPELRFCPGLTLYQQKCSSQDEIDIHSHRWSHGDWISYMSIGSLICSFRIKECPISSIENPFFVCNNSIFRHLISILSKTWIAWFSLEMFEYLSIEGNGHCSSEVTWYTRSSTLVSCRCVAFSCIFVCNISTQELKMSRDRFTFC